MLTVILMHVDITGGFCVFFANLYFINFSTINMYNLHKNCCSNNMLKIVKHFSPFQEH